MPGRVKKESAGFDIKLRRGGAILSFIKNTDHKNKLSLFF